MSHILLSKRVFVALLILLGIYSSLGPVTALAASSDCYLVSNAGIAEVNGIYQKVGMFNGRPAYQLNGSLGFFLAYDALGFGGEWNLTDSLGGGSDLYFKQSTFADAPLGYWYQGLDGLYPGATVKLIPCSVEGAETIVFDLVGGSRFEGTVKRSGIFTPASFSNGDATVTTTPVEFLPHRTAIKIYGNGLKVEISDTDGQTYAKFRGLNYVYFNLTPETARLWEAGVMQIYKHNLKGRKWTPITTYFVDAGEHGRLAALMYGPGYYVLGSPNENE